MDHILSWIYSLPDNDGVAQYLMALFAFLATCISIYGVMLLRKTLGATVGMLQETQRASDASNLAATAALRSTDMQMKAERAKLYILPTVKFFPSTSKKIDKEADDMPLRMIFHCEVRNIGRTPATDMVCDLYFVVTVDGATDIEFERLARLQHKRIRVSHPGIASREDNNPRYLFNELAIAKADYDSIVGFEKYAFLYGEIHYKDIFDEMRYCKFGFYYSHPPHGVEKEWGSLHRLEHPSFWESN